MCKVCVTDVNFAAVVRDKFIDICRLSMLNVMEIHQETLVDKREIRRPFVKPISRWKNNKKRYKGSMRARPELNLLGT